MAEIGERRELGADIFRKGHSDLGFKAKGFLGGREEQCPVK